MKSLRGKFQPSNELLSVLERYCQSYIPLLNKAYRWKIPSTETIGFNQPPGLTSYQANVELKKYLANAWEGGDFSQRLSLAKWVVKDWGGIRAGKIETIERFVQEINQDNLDFVFNRVASYSKILPCKSISEYAIYDQRVAVALNAIQLLGDVKNGVAFHMPLGRNNKVGNQAKKVGFSAQPEFRPKMLVANRGWMKLQKDDCYRAYLETLYSVQGLLGNPPIYDIEMVLFANAEDLAVSAMSAFSAKRGK